MKAIALLMTLMTINTFACPTVSLKNLTCQDSRWGESTVESVTTTPNSVQLVRDGEVEDYPLPYSGEDFTISCSGNSIIFSQTAGGKTVTSTTTFNGNTINSVGESFVWRCDAGPEGCDKGNYYLEGIESYTETCTAN